MIGKRILDRGVLYLLTGDLERAHACFRVGNMVQRIERVFGYTLPGFLLGYYLAGGFAS